MDNARIRKMTLSTGKALRFIVPRILTAYQMTKSANHLRITVTPVRSRKPKTTVNHERDSARQFSNQLLELLQNDQLNNLQNPDLFVSVIASAVQDLSKV